MSKSRHAEAQIIAALLKTYTGVLSVVSSSDRLGVESVAYTARSGRLRCFSSINPR
jgi:hypothetical protein